MNELQVLNDNQHVATPTPATPHTWVTNPYIQAATSDNTRKAYRQDISHYESSGGKLPATPEQVVNYLEKYAGNLNPRTLARRVVAIRHWHTYQGFSDPTAHPAITKTLSGIIRVHGKPKEKARALSADEMGQLATYLNQLDTLVSLRDNALLQIGFYGALRRSELVAIHIEHITWQDEGIEIIIPTSKTDQTHEGQFCVIPRVGHIKCPVMALEKWLKASGIHSGAVFRSISASELISYQPLTPQSVGHILKKRAAEISLPGINNISSHSLRRGLATSAAQAGAPIHVIMRAGRWKQTNTVMEYIEASERFTENAAKMVLEPQN